MEKPRYEGLESPEEKLYKESCNKIKDAVLKQGISFDEASALIEIKDEKLRDSILDDALKVLIAEMHFLGKKPLKEVAQTLKLPLKRLEKARKEMFKDVEESAVKAFREEIEGKGKGAD